MSDKKAIAGKKRAVKAVKKNAMEKVARKWHDGQLRKDGITPYVEHPASVAKTVEKWGFNGDAQGWAVAVAWAHDLIEETAIEKRKEVESEILFAAADYHEIVLEAVRLLSRDEKVFPVKDDYIQHVANNADFPVLAVKIADRICNTRDFLSLEGVGKEKAVKYFAAGEPLFKALERFTDERKKMIEKDIAEIRKKIS